MRTEAYQRYLDECRTLQGSPGGRYMLLLLRAAVEDWKEQSVGKPPDEVARLHGAVIKVRELIKEIEREPNLTEPRTGGYGD